MTTNKQYSWHAEIYDKALKDIALTAGKLYSDLDDLEYLGWLEWFERNYPNLYEKLNHAQQAIVKLWDNNDLKSMEEFKAAVKIEVDAMKWAASKYMEWQRQQKTNEALKGKQEALVL